MACDNIIHFDFFKDNFNSKTVNKSEYIQPLQFVNTLFKSSYQINSERGDLMPISTHVIYNYIIV